MASDKPKKKTSAGRRKIPIQKIQEKSKRHVAFSKRRMGLFKKASELCTLCGSEVAIIAYSEGGKAFAFGHPSADSVINRYLCHNGGSSSSSSSVQGLSSIQNLVDTTCSLDGMGLEELEAYAHGLQTILNTVIAKATSTPPSSSLVNPSPAAEEEFTADVDDVICPFAAEEEFTADIDNVMYPPAEEEFTADVDNVIYPPAGDEFTADIDNLIYPLAASEEEFTADVDYVMCPLAAEEEFSADIDNVIYPPVEEFTAYVNNVIYPTPAAAEEEFTVDVNDVIRHLAAAEEEEFDDVICPSLEELAEWERVFYGC